VSARSKVIKNLSVALFAFVVLEICEIESRRVTNNKFSTVSMRIMHDVVSSHFHFSLSSKRNEHFRIFSPFYADCNTVNIPKSEYNDISLKSSTLTCSLTWFKKTMRGGIKNASILDVSI